MIYERDCRAPWERVLCECRWKSLSRPGQPGAAGLGKKNDDLCLGNESIRGEDAELVKSAAGDGGSASYSSSSSVSPLRAPSAGHSSSAAASASAASTLGSSSSSSSSSAAGAAAATSSSALDKNLVDDGSFHTCCSRPVKVGEQWLIFGRRKSTFPFQCMVGPDWPMVILVYTLIIVINGVVLGLASPCLGWPVLLVGLAGFFVLLTAYTTVACSDPGIIYEELESAAAELSDEQDLEAGAGLELEGGGDGASINAGGGGSDGTGSDNGSTTPILDHAFSGTLPAPPSSSAATIGLANARPGNKRRGPKMETIHGVQCKTTMECGQCQIQRPFSARHCAYCGVCVESLDHHCPWCGKCIGASNMAAFSAFVGMLCLQGYLLAGIFIYWIVSCYIVSSAPKGPGY